MGGYSELARTWYKIIVISLGGDLHYLIVVLMEWEGEVGTREIREGDVGRSGSSDFVVVLGILRGRYRFLGDEWCGEDVQVTHEDSVRFLRSLNNPRRGKTHVEGKYECSWICSIFTSNSICPHLKNVK